MSVGRRFLSTFLSPTIYALSTAPGKAAIAVIRISGPASMHIYKSLTRSKKEPKARLATVRKLYQPGRSDLLDEALCLFFKGPHSYTGEDSLELQVHGGRAVIGSVMKAISSLHCENVPIKYAERGEFSRRGFQNGRFDLTEAEGINELINAETEVQRVSAMSSMKGETKALFNDWRTKILRNVALLTTVIDFGEDHDIDAVSSLFDRVEKNVWGLENEVKEYLEKTKRSQILMDGIKLALLGPPNAGKSSLLNILADDNKAIVSSVAGTTRDAIEIPLAISGYKVVLGDTAGIRGDAENEIEKEGIERAKLRSHSADLNLVVIAADFSELDSTFVDHVKSIRHQGQLLVIVNKSDLLQSESEKKTLETRLCRQLEVGPDQLRFISCKVNTGINDLTEVLVSKFKEITWTDRSEDPVVISKRAQDIIQKDVLQGFQDFHQFKETEDIVLASESLRFSMEGIGKITGEAIGVEEILSTVFSQFCIGK